MSPEEDQLLTSIRKKDSQAFEFYYKAQYSFFVLVACKYLEDIQRSREIVNDVFVLLWQDAHKLDVQVSLRSYLYRAVVNRCLNELTKAQRVRRDQLEYTRQPEPVVESKEMEDAELKVRLYKAIDALPEQCQKVFRMSRFEELKQQEIADRLGISIKTVKNHITHALKQLSQVRDAWEGLPVAMVIALAEILFKNH